MWAKYFPKSEILGIDLYDKSLLDYRRIKTFQGRQSDEEFLAQFNNLDIIIDDGSHINSDVIKSFEILFPRLNLGGYYCIEDTQVSGLNQNLQIVPYL
jgi:cephalosporin hydroxylase